MSTTTKRKSSLEDAFDAIRLSEESRRKGEESLRESLRESQRKTEESQRKTEASLRESQRKTEESLRESQKKTEKALQKTQEYLKKLGDNLDKANGNFNNKWGRFMENLVGGNLISLLQERGIKVDDLHKRIKGFRGSKQVAEYDLVALNGAEAVVFEVKTTLIKDNVTKFLKQLKNFKVNCPHLAGNRTVYGGIAYLTIDDKDHTEEEIKEYIDEQGLFLIQSPKSDAKISTFVNGKEFNPKTF